MAKYLSFFFLFLVAAVQLLSAASDQGKIEITAKDVVAAADIVKAKGDVVVHYEDSVIKANSATYDKSKKLLILDGNIQMIGYDGSKQHSDHIEIYTETEEVSFEKLFLISKNDVWLYSKDAQKQGTNYILGPSLISSCDMEDPTWKMAFTRSEYDSDEKYMKIHDAKVYLWDTPIFYTPYLAFTVDRQRTSGLLFPSFGYSSREGFGYEQPIFWAISPSMDMEFNPQIRTSRSLGLYSTFRFADSAHSSGTLRVGYFKDKKDYAEENNLQHDSHYGVEFNYDSSQVFSDKLSQDFTDGLYINSTYLNDIDYLNLQQSHLEHFGQVPLQESRVNYFLQNGDYYAGLNAKYFIDTRKYDNDDTLQQLPSIQLHKYLTHIIWDDLTYSVDFNINNLYREQGTTLKQAKFNIPLIFTTSFFDDFLNLSLGEEIRYSKYFFENGDYIHDEFKYYNNIHKVKLFTDLTKKYENFIHVLQPSLEYIKPGSANQSPVDFYSLTEEQQELFVFRLLEEQYVLRLSQYFYDEKMRLKFYQRFSQLYYLDREYELGDMINEMQYNWNRWSLYSNIAYSHEYGVIRESSSRIGMSESDYRFSVGHTYKKILPDVPIHIPNDVEANEVYFSFGYSFNEKFKLNGGLAYDIDEASSKQWRFGGSYHRDCWSATVSISQDITPRPTGYTNDTNFYLQLNFIPFGVIGTE